MIPIQVEARNIPIYPLGDKEILALRPQIYSNHSIGLQSLEYVGEDCRVFKPKEDTYLHPVSRMRLDNLIDEEHWGREARSAGEKYSGLHMATNNPWGLSKDIASRNKVLDHILKKDPSKLEESIPSEEDPAVLLHIIQKVIKTELLSDDFWKKMLLSDNEFVQGLTTMHLLKNNRLDFVFDIFEPMMLSGKYSCFSYREKQEYKSFKTGTVPVKEASIHQGALTDFVHWLMDNSTSSRHAKFVAMLYVEQPNNSLDAIPYFQGLIKKAIKERNKDDIVAIKEALDMILGTEWVPEVANLDFVKSRLVVLRSLKQELEEERLTKVKKKGEK